MCTFCNPHLSLGRLTLESVLPTSAVYASLYGLYVYWLGGGVTGSDGFLEEVTRPMADKDPS